MSNVKGYLLSLTAEEYEQLVCDIEGVKDELEELSREVDWYATVFPERMDIALEILSRANRDE